MWNGIWEEVIVTVFFITYKIGVFVILTHSFCNKMGIWYISVAVAWFCEWFQELQSGDC